MPDAESADNTMLVTPLQSQDVAELAPEYTVVEYLAGDEPSVPDEPVTLPARPPVFDVGQDPLADGTCYTATDGAVYYRPVFRIADRAPGLLAGPDVWFHRDNQGAIRLEWVLADVPPPDAPARAVPLPIAIDGVTVYWNEEHRDFDKPAMVPAGGPGHGPRLLLRGGAGLSPDEARTLELAMCDAATGCRLELYYSFDVQVDTPGDEELARNLLMEYGIPDIGPNDDVFAMLQDTITSGGFDPTVAQRALPRQDARNEGVTRVVPFVFNPNDEPNRPIYRALHGVANLTADWRKSAVGWLRDSGFPNTVYRMPDELRLAFNPSLGTPHVITTLHAADGGTAVRVLLRVVPWQDPRKVLETRELVGSPAARVVVGPVPSAALRLGGSFPEAIRLMGAAGGGPVAISLADGVDLLMDLSLEYDQLLCGMLGGAVGLPGQAELTLGADAVSVPVELRMDKVDDLPVAVEVPAQAGSPTAVRITNRAGTAIRLGGCAAVFLRVEAGSALPLATYRARCTSAFPLELAAGAGADLAFEAVDAPDGASWNAVLVDLLDKAMVDDARTVLLRANQLAGSGELTWDLRVSCPVFAAPEPPPRWAGLLAMEVEVSAPGFDTATVVLRRDRPSTTLSMRKPLTELVTAGASGIRTATYRVRNSYTDHQGQWTQPQQQSGEELLVYPNPAADD